MIHVYKTIVRSGKQARILEKEIDSIQGVKEWNFDLEDCDKILRIVANEETAKKIKDKIISLNFLCEELD